MHALYERYYGESRPSPHLTAHSHVCWAEESQGYCKNPVSYEHLRWLSMWEYESNWHFFIGLPFWACHLLARFNHAVWQPDAGHQPIYEARFTRLGSLEYWHDVFGDHRRNRSGTASHNLWSCRITDDGHQAIHTIFYTSSTNWDALLCQWCESHDQCQKWLLWDNLQNRVSHQWHGASESWK